MLGVRVLVLMAMRPGVRVGVRRSQTMAMEIAAQRDVSGGLVAHRSKASSGQSSSGRTAIAGIAALDEKRRSGSHLFVARDVEPADRLEGTFNGAGL